MLLHEQYTLNCIEFGSKKRQTRKVEKNTEPNKNVNTHQCQGIPIKEAQADISQCLVTTKWEQKTSVI